MKPAGAVPLVVSPVTLREAHALVARIHRHHKPSRGGLFAVAVASAVGVVGVAVIGRPVARKLDDGFTVEVVRLATDGTPNAPSMLLGASWRAARALGWRRCVTYTLPCEGGASLRASGWTCVGEAGGGTWSRTSRPRVDLHPTQTKIRWERRMVTS